MPLQSRLDSDRRENDEVSSTFHDKEATMSFKMTREEREAFLADLHVGVVGITSPDRGPVVVPVWYEYEPGGEIGFITAKESRKAELLRSAGRFTLCAQNEEDPYQYVSVEGPVLSIEETKDDSAIRRIARRYLGEEQGDAYVEETAGLEEVYVRMSPERWSTADYSKE
jgi:PPOX class probable F420-dependent enzyme